VHLRLAGDRAHDVPPAAADRSRDPARAALGGHETGSDEARDPGLPVHRDGRLDGFPATRTAAPPCRTTPLKERPGRWRVQGLDEAPTRWRTSATAAPRRQVAGVRAGRERHPRRAVGGSGARQRHPVAAFGGAEGQGNPAGGRAPMDPPPSRVGRPLRRGRLELNVLRDEPQVDARARSRPPLELRRRARVRRGTRPRTPSRALGEHPASCYGSSRHVSAVTDNGDND
jgi:hypothetical protein